MCIRRVTTIVAAALAVFCLTSGGSAADPPKKQRTNSLAVSPYNDTILAVSPEAAALAVIDAARSRVKSIVPIGGEPQTLSVDFETLTAYVTNKLDGRLYEVQFRDNYRKPKIRSVAVGWNPYGVLHTREHVIVSIAGDNKVAVVDRSAFQITREIHLPVAPRAMVILADQLYVSHLHNGLLSIIDLTKWSTKTIGSFSQASLQQGFDIDHYSNILYIPQTIAQANLRSLSFAKSISPVVTPIALPIGNLAPVFFLDELYKPVNLPIDAELSPDRRYLFVCNAGSNDLTIIDLFNRYAISNIRVGRYPTTITMNSNGSYAYVHNILDGSISVIETRTFQLVKSISVFKFDQISPLHKGKVSFNTAVDAFFSKDEWISCATCHFEGGNDLMVWPMPQGLRRTPSLYGVAITAPYHWDGKLNTLEEVNDTIKRVQGGIGFDLSNNVKGKDTQPLIALTTFLKSIKLPEYARRDAPNPAAVRGRELFNSARTACSTCHSGDMLTDRRAHDVGTGGSFDTPSLRLLFTTNKYMHDGRYTDLSQIIDELGKEDMHGKTRYLSEHEKRDLIEYLLSLKARYRE
jgi:YVTN family beta-propeller protein